jgi:hypothetical protein
MPTAQKLRHERVTSEEDDADFAEFFRALNEMSRPWREMEDSRLTKSAEINPRRAVKKG